MKWDTQVGDQSTLAPFALALRPEAWEDLSRAAETLASEVIEVEAALLRRPGLHRKLGLPAPVRRALAQHKASPSAASPRVIRFDFHDTPEGWRLSEANTDVPGGYNEAEGLPAYFSERYAKVRPCGFPGKRLAEALLAAATGDGVIAFVHATAYTDDLQVMLYLAKAVEDLGGRAVAVAPDHLENHPNEGWRAVWQGEHVPVSALARFFPAEWLPNLGRKVQWRHWFLESTLPQANPATALLTQSKRHPLLWKDLGVPVPAWETFLPESVCPAKVRRDQKGWVLKPALGRVGEGVVLEGVTPPARRNQYWSNARWHPADWVAQRQFDTRPVQVNGEFWYPCFGVYTVNGKAAGVYGRAARSPLISETACDVAVLVDVPHTPGENT